MWRDGGETHQSTHWGKTDWKVSEQEHLITSINAPGLKRTCDMMEKHRGFGQLSEGLLSVVHTVVTLDKTVAAWAQELMLE
jgi:hypothetical protein